MCDWRKLLWRVTSRPEIEISDKRLAFSSQTSSIEPSYKTGPKQVKMSISQKVQGLWKNFRLQHVLNLVALTVRRPKHPSLVWCITIFLYETFSRLIPRDSNLGHHIEVLFVKPTVFILLLFATLPECSQNQTAVSDTLRLLSDF